MKNKKIKWGKGRNRTKVGQMPWKRPFDRNAQYQPLVFDFKKNIWNVLLNKDTLFIGAKL